VLVQYKRIQKRKHSMKKIKEVRELEIHDVNSEEAARLFSKLYYEIINKPVEEDYVYDIHVNIPNCNYEKAFHIIDDLRYVCMMYGKPEGSDLEIANFLGKMRQKITKGSNKKNRTYDINIIIPNNNYERVYHIVMDIYCDCIAYKNPEKEVSNGKNQRKKDK